MLKAFLAVSALGVAEVLNASSRRIAKAFGGRSGDRIEIHLAPWRTTLRGKRDGDLWEIELSLLIPREDFCERRFRTIHKPKRIGRLVIAQEFATEGGGETYILDAKDEEIEEGERT